MSSYQKIVTDIINKITSLELKPGDKLSTETEMIEYYSSSKMTVRKAIARLKALDIVETIERQGTFIRKKNISTPSSEEYTIGYTLCAILKGVVPTVDVIDFKIIEANSHIASKLEIPINSKVYYIKRLRKLDNKPSALELMYIPFNELPNLTLNDVKGSVYKKLYENKELMVTTNSLKIQAIVPTYEIMKLLELDQNEAVFYIEKTSKTDSLNNFEYVLSFQAGSRIII